MKVVIVGCGRLGAELAYRLFRRGHEVSVVDLDEHSFSKLPSDFEGRYNEGNALNREVMHRAGIETADAVAALTDSDLLNGVIGHLAKSEYGIQNVIVRNFDPQFRAIHEAYGLQQVSALSWGAQRIEELIYHSDVRMVFSSGNGEVEVYEIVIPENCNGRRLNDLLTPGACIAVSVTRAGRGMLPEGDMALEPGDVVLVSATVEGVITLRGRLCEPASRKV